MYFVQKMSCVRVCMRKQLNIHYVDIIKRSTESKRKPINFAISLAYKQQNILDIVYNTRVSPGIN